MASWQSQPDGAEGRRTEMRAAGHEESGALRFPRRPPTGAQQGVATLDRAVDDTVEKVGEHRVRPPGTGAFSVILVSAASRWAAVAR